MTHSLRRTALAVTLAALPLSAAPAQHATDAGAGAASATSAPARPNTPGDWGPTIATALVQLGAMLSQRDRLRRLASRLVKLEDRVSDVASACERHRHTPAAPLAAQGAA